jgi:hypothetical protein
MSNPICGLLAAAAAVSLTVPGPANAESVAYRVTSPVTISSVTVDEATFPAPNLDSEPTYFATGVTLKFINKGNVTATTVIFALRDGVYSHGIVDKGKFSPGVEIKHAFAIDGLNAFSSPEADVTEIDFADGSSWHESNGGAK